MTPKTSISTLHPTRSTPTTRRAWLAVPIGLALLHGVVQAADTSPAQQLERFSAQAAAPGQAERGRMFFNSRQGGEWSCAACHGNPPTKPGKHASTGKSIGPMAPAFNPNAFTDTGKVDKWFRRNCKDVLQRECSAGEKADVLAYLIGLKP
jgi:cytochrome c553